MPEMKKINFKIYAPCEELKPYVKNFWFINNDENKTKLEYKVLSDCCSGLVFNFGDEIIYELDGKTYLTSKECILLGPTKSLLKFNFMGKVQSVGVRFFPGTGHHFFSCSMHELTDEIVHMNGSTDIQKQLMATESRVEIISIIESYLLNLLQRTNAESQVVLLKAMAMMEAHPTIEISEVCEQLDISKRVLQRMFKTYVGISPKNFMRVKKIFISKTKIAADDFKSLAELSIDSGYFDQAHFIRDFKNFMEETPKRYYRIKKGDGQ